MRTTLTSLLFLFLSQFAISQATPPKRLSSDIGIGYGQTYLFSSSNNLISKNFKVFQTVEYQASHNILFGLNIGADYIYSTNDSAKIQEVQVPISFNNVLIIVKKRDFIRHVRFGFGYNIPINTTYSTDDSYNDFVPIKEEQIGSHPFVLARVGFGIRNKAKEDFLRWEIGYSYKRLNTNLPYNNNFVEAIFLINVF